MSTFFKKRRENCILGHTIEKKNQPVMNWPVLDFQIEMSEKKN